MFAIYYIHKGRRVQASVRYETAEGARLGALARSYYDGKLWKVRQIIA